ncbi:VOC family protein [Candidatus Odyssella thessalonicensis]|uniref:VOC family protein n=1 Tax=Candidatus Odyssella thessalonicensis TaxID=84647 RepID=UPI000225AC5F|nr:VOC family protein [Candidatus Odyssella thessalonicensis]
MNTRPYKPDGIPALFPYLVVKDANKAIEFYKKAFGFTLSSDPAKDDNGKIQHVEMKFGQDVWVMFAPEGCWDSPRRSPATLGVMCPLSLYIYCKDVDALYEQALANGATSTMKPKDGFWGDRFCTLIDPDGYEWMFATNIADHKS